MAMNIEPGHWVSTLILGDRLVTDPCDAWMHEAFATNARLQAWETFFYAPPHFLSPLSLII